ncbi:MAG TPA: ATP-binding protein [Caulobacteraceae bacterium]|jgi:signal transduction histidine kinase|nr:ATP-binding protein [Caulobacteraceae bacterium]
MPRANPSAPPTLSLDDLPMAVAALDADHCITHANPAFRELLEHACSVTGMRLSDAFEAAGVHGLDSTAGKIFHLERAGEACAFQLTLRAQEDGAVVFLRDVSQERLAAVRSHMAEDVRSQLMHDAEIGFWRYDPDTDLYHFPSELSLGHGDGGSGAPLPRAVLQQIQHRDDQAKDTEIRERITHEGGAAESEMRYLSADGGWKHLRVLYRAGVRLPSGRYEMFGVSYNVTQLAQARDVANLGAQRLDLALKASHAGVFEYDYKNDRYWVSAEFAALMGPDAMAKFEAEPFAFLSDDDRRRALEMGLRARDGLPPEPINVRLLRPDGARWVRVYFEAERAATGKPRRGVGLMIDVDETVRQELAVRDAREAAEAATRAKSDFLASVSHEIRTPMNGIVGVLNLLKQEQLTDGGRALLGEALGCTVMLSGLINDVLDFSKIEAGKLELSPAPTDCVAVTKGVLSLLKPQADDKGLALRAVIAPEVGWAMVDPVRLRQCLFNIIGNAVKFTAAGAVEVRVAAPMPGTLRFEVEDTGIGVPEDARSRLFDRFEQVDGGTTRRFGGTGLGLAISRQLARMMGGDLDYSSREGEGSIFWFEIEAPATGAPEAGDDAVIDAAPLAGLRVLVVDDNRVNRLVGVKTLEALGAVAEAVDGGEAAIEAVRTQGFDLVLMDVNMPGMDGVEATRRIRRLEAPCANVPIVALTADVMRHQHDRYFAAGMNGVVPKPFSLAELLAELTRLSAPQASESPASTRSA